MIKVILWFFDIVLVLIIAMGFMRDAYGWCIEDPDENAKIDAALDWHYLDGVTLTAYCNCPECCGQWSGGPTYSGVMPQAGHTIAVDPDVIPLGAWVEINGQLYHAEDTGGAIRGKRIDIFFGTHDEALDFGRRNGVTVRWYPDGFDPDRSRNRKAGDI